ncbi:MAG: bifunctional folylpolyglutamate synthase/dihydrofolate synthase [Euryarchaeota archaeon]|nr:bifunctional folylpolyglutamate synthase/dihydrofolate synthase [Euryarchaeota archaeon]
MKYDEALEWLFSLENMGIKLGLDRMQDLMAALGNPERSFRSVHVAGTNGKGSVCAMLASIFQEAGLVTGLYTSPHLVDFEERIQVQGAMVPKVEVAALAEEIRQIVESPEFPKGRRLTFFEITTAIAFLHFKRKGVQMAVVEVGMGGRLDATNVIEPLCTVITRISLEHTQHLGDTVAKIAFEKAGIIKENVTVITAETDETALRVIDAVARDHAAPLLVAGREFDFKVTASGWDGIMVRLGSIDGTVKVPLVGAFQASNAAMACECALDVSVKSVRIREKDISSGLSKVIWPGRIEVVSERPRIVFDVSHTPDGAKVVADELKMLHDGRWVLVLGVLDDKDIEGIAGTFGGMASKAIATSPKTKRAYPAETVAKALREHCDDVTVVSDVGAAIDEAIESCMPGEAILVTGSLYMIGEAKEWLEQRRRR